MGWRGMWWRGCLGWRLVRFRGGLSSCWGAFWGANCLGQEIAANVIAHTDSLYTACCMASCEYIRS